MIVPLPRDHGNEEELRRDLQRVSSAALGYDQPVEIKPMTDGADPNPVRGKLAPAWATNLGACVAGRVGPQEAVAGEHALRPTPSETDAGESRPAPNRGRSPLGGSRRQTVAAATVRGGNDRPQPG